MSTVGSEAIKLLENPDRQQPVVDTSREMLKGYIDSLIQCARHGESIYGKEDPFYICVQTRRERLLTNVIRNQFYSRKTRPSPQYDLALYWYDPKDEKMQFVWCIPDRETVHHLHANGPSSREDQKLAEFCRSFLAGTLY